MACMLTFHRFEIDGDEADWEEAERRARESAAKRTGKTDPMTVTVKAKRKAEAPAAAPEAETESHKRHKSHKKKHRER